MEKDHMNKDNGRSATYEKGSLTLVGAVSMGTGVMIGAGILALTGQVAELAGTWFPLAFLTAAVVAGFSAYSYVKLAQHYPSAGGIAMFLEKIYGKSMMTGACALLMYFSMVINESLVARTFGSYVLQLFDGYFASWAVPGLGVGLLAFAFVVNILSNRVIETFSFVMSFIKVGGLVALALGGLWASGMSMQSVSVQPMETGFGGFFAAVAIGILAYKGFTTITNSGGEITKPHKNIGRAIVLSIGICLVLYLLVCFAVGGNLSIERIVHAKDYVLAEAARPTFGKAGVWITVGFAIAATVSGIIASVFAVSRMLAMLTDMNLVPHSHFGMPGTIQKHTLVYTIVLAMLLTIFFDLSRIASMGAIFYILMDMAIHGGVLIRLKDTVKANAAILVTALILDAVVLGFLIHTKIQTDIFVVYASLIGLLLIFVGERLFLRFEETEDG